MSYQMYPDNCERCLGTMGGVRGNENRHPREEGGYIVLCDYCSVEVDEGLGLEMPCGECTRPLGVHSLINTKSIEAIWREGIAVSVCAS